MQPVRHVLRHVEQRLRVVADVRQELADRRRVGRREVDVAAPHPAHPLAVERLPTDGGQRVRPWRVIGE